jgi:ribosomal protein S8E
MTQSVTFYADSKSFRTRNSDNANLITFETGEYQKNEVLEVVKLPDDTVYKVTVECVDQPEQSSSE